MSHLVAVKQYLGSSSGGKSAQVLGELRLGILVLRALYTCDKYAFWGSRLKRAKCVVRRWSSISWSKFWAFLPVPYPGILSCS